MDHERQAVPGNGVTRDPFAKGLIFGHGLLHVKMSSWFARSGQQQAGRLIAHGRRRRLERSDALSRRPYIGRRDRLLALRRRLSLLGTWEDSQRPFPTHECFDRVVYGATADQEGWVVEAREPPSLDAAPCGVDLSPRKGPHGPQLGRPPAGASLGAPQALAASL